MKNQPPLFKVYTAKSGKFIVESTEFRMVALSKDDVRRRNFSLLIFDKQNDSLLFDTAKKARGFDRDVAYLMHTLNNNQVGLMIAMFYLHHYLTSKESFDEFIKHPSALNIEKDILMLKEKWKDEPNKYGFQHFVANYKRPEEFVFPQTETNSKLTNIDKANKGKETTMTNVLGTAQQGAVIVSTGIQVESIDSQYKLVGTDGKQYRSNFPYAGMYSVGDVIATTTGGHLSHPSTVVNAQ